MDERRELSPGRQVVERGPDGRPGRTFEIIRVLGRGGLGLTYRAFEVGRATEVALKEFFPADMAQRVDEDTLVYPLEDRRRMFELCRKAFSHEARAIARFEHPNIVRVQPPFDANQTAYFPMEMIQGQSLDALRTLNGGPSGRIAWRDFKPLLDHMLDALEHMHEAEVLHLDLKPANVMVDLSGRAIFIDFGSSRQKLNENGDTDRAGASSSLRFVSEGFSPPEQMTAGGKVDTYSDIYSLAATAYQCLAGVPRLPRAMGNPAMIEENLKKAQPDLPSEVINMIKRSLAVAPGERPQSVAELKSLLRSSINSSQGVIWVPPKKINRWPFRFYMAASTVMGLAWLATSALLVLSALSLAGGPA